MTASKANNNAPDLETLSPPLKWAGGKRWLLPYLKPIWAGQQRRRLVEPFCGGLAVALGLNPERALLNDQNGHVINFYRWVQRGLRLTIDMRNDSTLYYAQRAEFNRLIRAGIAQGDNGEQAAQLFYFLNRTGYNGLCRFNRSGEFNVPFGKYKTINYADDFLAYADVLTKWEFCAGPFERVTLTVDDLLYADPPYDVEFVQYSAEGFNWNDQVRLAEWLAAQPCPVIASNQATIRIVELYERLGFMLQFLESPRRINSTGDRTPAREIVALKGF
jgi:DNA adenine methylase